MKLPASLNLYVKVAFLDFLGRCGVLFLISLWVDIALPLTIFKEKSFPACVINLVAFILNLEVKHK